MRNAINGANGANGARELEGVVTSVCVNFHCDYDVLVVAEKLLEDSSLCIQGDILQLLQVPDELIRI